MPDGLSSQVSLSQNVLVALLDAIDDAFHDVLQGRYGGGITIGLNRAGALLDERPARPIPVGLADELIFDLSLSDGASQTDAPVDQSASIVKTPLGAVEVTPPPGSRAGDVDVITEIFDDRDPNEAVENGRFTTGLLLCGAPDGQAGHMPGRGLSVVRSDDSIEAGNRTNSQSQRGWLPLQPRGQVNRGAGLGSNGHRRAGDCLLTYPVSRALLARLGDRIAQVEEVGAMIERIQIGVRSGDAAAR